MNANTELIQYLMATGPGKLSLDAWIKQRCN